MKHLPSIMNTKTINISAFPKVDNLEKERATVERVLRASLFKFRNENNVNVIDDAIASLSEEFVYVPSPYTLWEGRYVRYLDLTNPLLMRLKTGGFIVADNTYTVTIKNELGIYRVAKRGRLWFMKLNSKDLTYMKYSQLLS
jgi:hypothetical protein